jgi:pimeloyl-ACP methyl ester carboxylesterase
VADRLPIVLLHGYSASQASFRPWRDALVAAGYDATAIHLGDYVSLSNEITIKDIAEGLDRALREEAGLGPEDPFDALVHSTGGLVIREWLATYGSRRKRLKRLVCLAPASFGSPLAHKGQSWLSAVFKGERELGPDFMETGHLVLLGLELGSPYTWELAHRDLLRDVAIYDETPASPFPFVIVGLSDYGRLKRMLFGDPGSDGTVRWAGAGLNTRKIVLDLTREPGEAAGGRIEKQDFRNIDAPLALVPGFNHGTIVAAPDAALIAMVTEALAVEDMTGFEAWRAAHSSMTPDGLGRVKQDRWQQFVVRVVDERGDPVPDYFIELADGEGEHEQILDAFSQDVHAYTEDASFRCFHVNLTKLDPDPRRPLHLRLGARSGTELVGYHGVGSETFSRGGQPAADAPPGAWDARMELTELLTDPDVQLFFPYTTTLLEIRINREPMPPTGINRVLSFGARP